jgi:Reverse transcriptase (RNA-dependent DNA polymerase)
LYLRLLKALYGCVQSALLWYNLFTGTLQKLGYKLNPYDSCIANKMVNGKQSTIVWYVDDTKISHVDSAVVTSIIEAMEGYFGKMTVTRGKDHVFLGMHIHLNDNKTVDIIMKSYIEQAIEDFGEAITFASTPARKNLFDIRQESPRLNEERAEVFHGIVQKMLYVAQRARIDVLLAIAFLCTRVREPTKEDWEKLKRVLQFLHRTIDDVRTIGADDLSSMVSWVDAAFAVHMDMKSHTGGAISFGWGVVLPRSTKQKLNTKSSTEAEVVGASDYLPNTIWTKMFMEEQGYPINTNRYAQDNQSAIKLEVNGRSSAGSKSRHINIRYFFMKDRVKTEKIDIFYCPTEAMLADFFTKALQGALFEKFRRVLMGRDHISTLHRPEPVPVAERVEGKRVRFTTEPGPDRVGEHDARRRAARIREVSHERSPWITKTSRPSRAVKSGEGKSTPLHSLEQSHRKEEV